MAAVTQNGASNGATDQTPNGTSNGTPAHRRIFLFTHGRTASNLLMKMFAKHPQLVPSDYNFHNAFMFGPERLMHVGNADEMIPPERLEACKSATYQRGFDGLQETIAKAEAEGKIPFVKEHAYFIFDPNIIAANLPMSPERKVAAKPIVVDHSVTQANGTTNGTANHASTSSATSTNPTVLPDSFLRTLSPVIVIRHPARMVPSYYRAMKSSIGIDLHDGNFPVLANFLWSRLVFDWYAQHVCGSPSLPGPTKKSERTGPSWPIVIDGDDLINDENVAKDFCKQMEIDPQYLQTSWDMMPEEQRAKQGIMLSAFLGTIQKSTGVVKSQEVDMDKEKEKMLADFGVEVGGTLAEFVERAMPHYLYLREYRL